MGAADDGAQIEDVSVVESATQRRQTVSYAKERSGQEHGKGRGRHAREE